MTKPLRGAGGGGKGGGSSRTPKEAPDNLLTDSTAYIIDVVSEGPIEGWADPENPAKCIYFDDTPLQSADGTFTVEGVEFFLRTGLPDQEPVPGFAQVENEINVGVQFTKDLPVTRTISSADVDAVRIKVGFSVLTKQEDDGDLKGTSVTYHIDMQAGAGNWERVGTYTTSGKTTSGYQRAYRVELPDIRPVSIRLVRETPDSESSALQNDTFFVSYAEIIDAKLTYPNTAYVALAVPAQAFGGRIPRRSYRLKGIKCWVPINYDPETRTYDETTIWDGTFKLAYSNNPAFFTYTVYIEDRWGLGERIDPQLVDKWRIYQIGKYCDALVDDGQGGQEPRFTINGVMMTREAAYDVVTQLSATFRGVTYWGAGAIVPVQDAPSDPVKLVSNANVVDGAFTYSGAALAAHKTAVVASYRDPTDHYRLKANLVHENIEAIQRFDRRQVDISLPYQTSRGGALREAKWLVDTNINQQEGVTYQAGFDHAAIRPGDRVLISDRYRSGFRMTGRLVSISPDRREVELDAPALVDPNASQELLVAKTLGDITRVDVVLGLDGPGNLHQRLQLSTPLPPDVVPGAVFILWATNLPPRLFRVISNTPDKHLFTIVAVEDDPNKYARIEEGLRVEDPPPYLLPDVTGPPLAPQALATRLFYRRQPAGLVATVSWEQPGGTTVLSWRVEFKGADGVRALVAETRVQSIDIPLEGTATGPFEVFVSAQNALGVASGVTQKTFSVGPDLLFPGDVPDLRITAVGERIELAWPEATGAVAHYHVKFLARGLPGGWPQAVDVDPLVPGRSLSVPALQGTYLVKAVSIFGFQSRSAITAENAICCVQALNVVKTLDEAPAFPGPRSGPVVIEAGSLILRHDGGDITEGSYSFAERVDLTEVYASRLSARLRAFGFSETNAISSWERLRDVDSLTGVADTAWSIRLQLRTTVDDPADLAAVWTEWADFYVGDYAARGFQFRILMATTSPQATVRVDSAAIEIDMPDRIEAGDDVPCPPAGVFVPFTPAFREKPAITVTGQGLPSGAVSERSGVSRAGFTQRFVDDTGQGVSCTFDWVAKGYGRVQT
ncbi:host specificity protein J [Pseudaestuariivita rosea]|uniref:host specificity protein J n=1 Tax=Pseudaestuariivita rosea TaxID=2763263 RepID=UPI001ABAA8C2|nr:phage tail protein [Pseudaestuariivita rosea]